MSTTEFSAPEKGTNSSVPAAVASLNQVVQEVLKKRTQEFIVRCEELPPIEVDRYILTSFFDTLLEMIASQSAQGRLFLYIDSEENRTGQDDPEIKGNSYLIRFHTNMSAGTEWKSRHDASILRCGQLISSQGGSFMVNNINNAGCVFCIILPAKPK